MAITKSDLDFMEEAKRAFMRNEQLSTYRDTNGHYIALRASSAVSRDSITILKTFFIADFQGVLPEAKPLVLKDS